MGGLQEALVHYMSGGKTSTQDLLHNAVAKQKENLQKEEKFPFNELSIDDIFGWFKGTERFKRIFDKITKYLISDPLKDLDKKFNRVAGALYEGLTYSFLASCISSPHILLSPKMTFEFYQMLYPYNKAKEDDLGFGFINDNTLPDGLLIEETGDRERVISIYEYTLVNDNRARNEGYFSIKSNSFLVNKDRLREIYAETELIFVVPDGFNECLLEGKEGKYFSMPFTHYQFGKFFSDLSGYYKNSKNGETLLEICRRVKEQREIIKSTKGQEEPVH